MDPNYIPYDTEWEKELMKLPKKFLIGRYREACMRNPGEDQAKLSMLINCVNQEMGNIVEWTGDHWQWKK